MALNRLFDTIDQARETAHWEAAFGEPQHLSSIAARFLGYTVP